MYAITLCTNGATLMALTTTCPNTLTDTAGSAPYSPEWHQQQEREERAWLDDFARSQRDTTDE